VGEATDRMILAALVRKLGPDAVPVITQDDLDGIVPHDLWIMMEPNRGVIMLRYRPGRATVESVGIERPLEFDDPH
jgi:hypothetical protein